MEESKMILKGNVFSKTLEMDTGITIVTPNNFKQKESYKVAYLLHGICGNNSTWTDYSLLPVYGNYGDTVYVMPDGARSFYTDMKSGYPYYTYISDELPKICKSIFNISSKREDTAIIGASMGGYGALKCALSKPEQYGMCGAFSSPCLFLKEGMENQRENGSKPEFIERYGRKTIEDFVLAFGDQLEWNPQDEILELMKAITNKAVLPKIYMACGTRDMFLSDHRRFKDEADQSGYVLNYEEWEGAHDFNFFDEGLKRAIGLFSL